MVDELQEQIHAITALKQYLDSLLGQRTTFEPLPKSEVSGLPMYLTRAYAPYRISLFGHDLIALVGVSGETRSPLRLARDVVQFRDRLRRDVFVVLDRVEAWARQRLVGQGIPFAVPGYQLYLPMLLIDLRERFPRKDIVDGKHVSWAGQVLLLRHLLFDDVSGRSLSALAELLDYSVMTMSKVASELAVRGLATARRDGRCKILTFSLSNFELWERAIPHLRSPVLQCRYVRGDDASLYRAGLDALALHSSLQPDAIPTSAVSKTRFSDITALVEVQDQLEAEQVVELWSYDPKNLTDSMTVDPLSLHLALAEDPDERVQIALEQMMEGLPWSKA